MKKSRSYSIFVIVVFFLFMLLHQTDKLMIGSMQTPISKTFGLTDLQWGVINSGALIVATLFYPIWGDLCDRYARAKLLALASFIWGATTWLSSVVKTYPQFLITRASTGIDVSSYPGLYSLVADYFKPRERGRIYSLLQFSQPIGYLVGMIDTGADGRADDWRLAFRAFSSTWARCSSSALRRVHCAIGCGRGLSRIG